jgi:hypothetical protein
MMELNSAASRKKQSRPRGYIQNYRPQTKTVGLLDDVTAVLNEYRQHWPLTVRQVFYRLIGAYGHPKTEPFYGKLCHHMANARRGRLIPFDAIRDDGVTQVSMEHFDDEDHFRGHIREMGLGYKRNKLAAQRLHVEVWCEAAGMIFQLADVAHRYSIETFSSSGFDSLTAKKNLANRICVIGKPTVILHLGDYDPSGEAIFLSVAEDVSEFVVADRPWNTVTVDFRRIALTEAQVTERGLPTAPPKTSDSRSRRWSGETCQLEALPPDAIAQILEQAIEGILDDDLLQDDIEQEAIDRQRIVYALPAPETPND